MKIKDAINKIVSLKSTDSFGKVNKVIGLVIEGKGLNTSIGSVCEVILENGQSIPAEVVGFRNSTVLLMPYGELRGIKPGSYIKNFNTPPYVKVGPELLGRVVDSFLNPLDGRGKINVDNLYPLYAEPLNPILRRRIDTPLDVGVRAINGLLTIGKGQRIAIMAGSGVGKSTLLGMMARYTNADVNVICLVGERGREVNEFIEDSLGEDGLKKSVVVVATSDLSPLERIRAVYTAQTIAEYFRDMSKDVLFMMDSITRFAMASREVGLSIGEPPTTKGYTPSVFSQLPKLLERAGTSDKGTITGIYTVLVEGDDFTEPIADAVRSIVDGHIVLTRELADQGHYPAIDVLKSISRLRSQIIDRELYKLGNKLLSTLATYKRVEDMINIGAYSKGSNTEIDYAIEKIDRINEFLTQDVEERSSLEDSFARLRSIIED
ncbi:FliI/YscN family ATPase [Desulfothermus sp.]